MLSQGWAVPVGTRTPSSPGALQHQCDSPSSLWGCVRKCLLFLGWAEQREGLAERSQQLASLVLGGKLSKNRLLRLLWALRVTEAKGTPPANSPPPQVPGPPAGCAPDLWSPNPHCALRSRGNGMDRTSSEAAKIASPREVPSASSGPEHPYTTPRLPSPTQRPKRKRDWPGRGSSPRHSLHLIGGNTPK